MTIGDILETRLTKERRAEMARDAAIYARPLIWNLAPFEHIGACVEGYLAGVAYALALGDRA